MDAVVASFAALTECDESQIDRCYSQDYLEHAPTVPGSTREALKQFVLSFGPAHPRGELRLQRLLADGDYVYVESAGRFEPEDGWTTINEVFRLEDGIIVEHWESTSPAEDPAEPYRRGLPMANVKVIASDGVELAVDVHGPTGRTPVVFLHGVTSSRATYDWLPNEITAGRKIVKTDHRGHGESGHKPDSYSLSRYVDDTIRILETLTDRPAVLVGFSLGGAIGWTIAQKRPDLVKAVFLEDPALFPEFVYSTDTITSVLRWTLTQRRAWHAQKADPDQIVRELAAKTLGPNDTFGSVTQPASMPVVAYSLMVLDPGVTESAIDGTMTQGIDTISQVQVPTFILAADEAAGGAFPRQYDRQIIQTHSNVEIHRVEGSPHTIHTSLIGRDAYVRHLAKFLDEHAPS
ncbi:alpha/beta fold hydrolase [Mycolicibacterium peregrinum]|uniref:alpha/beta fold hydrolase n=1 Tax=Mycolicibacterium peregrinum TaxID=43304 RepID=UPI0006D83334|nr:alpha/beta fold hydrolase [Mycolicibacterium peregrinum]MCV7203809.1 alpha/beta fold hydrolase [Mycolicibacterium peregrinum]ORW58182.1 hypothetical protein AWC21_15890 [Mycolicibacterium peregrinum]